MQSRINNDSDEIKPMFARSGGGCTAMDMTSGAHKSKEKKNFFLRFAAITLVLLTAVLCGGAQTVQAAPAEDKVVIVLDAGHGGRDPGAVDLVNDYTEAQLVESMAQRMADHFAPHADEVEIVLTRSPGEFVSINERAAVANRVDADLFVSLHLNAADNRDAQGFQIFPAPPGRTHHADSLQVSEDILQHVRQIGRPVMGGNGVFYAYYSGGSKVFYDATQYNEVNRLSSFGVLENADCPAILVEQWFISNEEDMAFYNNDHGQDLMARQLYRGICDFFDMEYKA